MHFYVMQQKKSKRKLSIGEKTKAISCTTYQRACDDRAAVLSTIWLVFPLLKVNEQHGELRQTAKLHLRPHPESTY